MRFSKKKKERKTFSMENISHSGINAWAEVHNYVENVMAF